MILVGRLLSVPAGLIFFVLLLVTLVVLQINATFLDPDFYPEELRKADIYEFVLVDLLSWAVDEYREQDPPEGLDENPLVTSGLSTEDIVSSVNRAIPPEWVQGLAEEAFDQFGRYLTGERDQFAFTARAGDQVVAIKDEVKTLLRKANAYDLLFEQVVDPAVKDAVTGDLPLGVDISSDRLVEAARITVPPEWVQTQVESVLDEVTPYIVGERDTFKISILLADRVEIALAEIKRLLREADAYELLYNEIIEPEVKSKLGQDVELPFGVTITQEEVVSALRRVAPPSWVQQQAEAVIDAATPYLTGKEDSFTVEVSLVDNKRQAREVIDELASQKVTELIDSVPKCQSLTEADTALFNRDSRGLPACIPQDIPGTELLSRLGIDIGGGVTRFVLSPIPDTITFTDGQLRTALDLAGAGDNLEQVDEVRKILKEGWSYTQDDLHRQLRGEDWDENLTGTEEDPVKTLNDIRSFLADGLTVTEADFRERLSREPDGSSLEIFDRARDYFVLARTFKWVVYLPVVILLVVIGFLGGRSWSGRAAWAAGALLVSAGLIFAIWGPGYDALAKSGPIYEIAGIGDLDELREDALIEISESGQDFPNTSRLVANKTFDIAESIVDDFASGISRSSLALAAIGLIVLVTSLFWASINSVVDRITAGRGSD